MSRSVPGDHRPSLWWAAGWRAEATVYRSVRLRGVRKDDLAAWPWIGVDEQLAHLASAHWLRRQDLDSRVAVRTNSLVNVLNLVRSGVGLGALPCYLGDRDQGLRRVFSPPREWRSELWLLTRVELRTVPRIRRLFDTLQEGTREAVNLLESRIAQADR